MAQEAIRRHWPALGRGHSDQLQHQSEAVGVYSTGLGKPKWKSRYTATQQTRKSGFGPTWTGLPSFPGISGGNWVTGLDDAAQEKIVREIAGQKEVCVIYNRR